MGVCRTCGCPVGCPSGRGGEGRASSAGRDRPEGAGRSGCGSGCRVRADTGSAPQGSNPSLQAPQSGTRCSPLARAGLGPAADSRTAQGPAPATLPLLEGSFGAQRRPSGPAPRPAAPARAASSTGATARQDFGTDAIVIRPERSPVPGFLVSFSLMRLRANGTLSSRLESRAHEPEPVGHLPATVRRRRCSRHWPASAVGSPGPARPWRAVEFVFLSDGEKHMTPHGKIGCDSHFGVGARAPGRRGRVGGVAAQRRPGLLTLWPPQESPRGQGAWQGGRGPSEVLGPRHREEHPQRGPRSPQDPSPGPQQSLRPQLQRPPCSPAAAVAWALHGPFLLLPALPLCLRASPH